MVLLEDLWQPAQATGLTFDAWGTLRTFGDVELHLLVLFQALVPLALDGAVVHEHIGAVLLGDETVPLLGVEPLHRASSHRRSPPFLAGPNLAAVRRPRLHGRRGNCFETATMLNPLTHYKAFRAAGFMAPAALKCTNRRRSRRSPVEQRRPSCREMGGDKGVLSPP